MRALLQRVSEASVSVAGREIARIHRGLVVFVAVFHDDDEAAARRLAERTLAARIFPDGSKAMNRSVLEIGGAVLAVSQFTLAADTRRGNRPSFGPAAPPAQAQELYDRYVEALREDCPEATTGEFGADMQVSLVNDGPVTILLDVPY
ncbi:MAG: D-aminoacyl-tRNA deacylase [Gammaproteobacteria bacterium]|nr:D-aminoacyl-tRNA deacylase [Gammaproteobacteria bacterium]MDE0442373.1 D-aminoacyl-tRNA deacylase [Gammaproteobacteria bacterium]